MPGRLGPRWRAVRAASGRGLGAPRPEHDRGPQDWGYRAGLQRVCPVWLEEQLSQQPGPGPGLSVAGGGCVWFALSWRGGEGRRAARGGGEERTEPQAAQESRVGADWDRGPTEQRRRVPPPPCRLLLTRSPQQASEARSQSLGPQTSLL